METSTIAKEVELAPVPAIQLGIAGADVLLKGRFHHWMPVALIQAKDDEGLAQVLFDVTSTRPGSTGATDSLFEFQAKTVKAAGPQTYKLGGQLKSKTPEGIESGEIEAVLESPQGHTPFFAITFTIDRSKFARLWSAFEDRAAHAIAKGQSELRPWAWLREPELAAA